ncbi:hypothetical protein DE146DRAFT_633368 [Phaeosphaeria sp. MPI-PUGE-AT-0046c]|nr:hypothetical protein DE146DRAFT_633368 [Phaeosphaeria sp. MPI-PUGE-AT-0046c]
MLKRTLELSMYEVRLFFLLCLFMIDRNCGCSDAPPAVGKVERWIAARTRSRRSQNKFCLVEDIAVSFSMQLLKPYQGEPYKVYDVVRRASGPRPATVTTVPVATTSRLP